ncbi:helix-turn-helix domain-containing protein [Henriciella sp.]|uniref:helix-turn-helix transcriptional regulator n=1 Tax=Henriciella sp. TaxID=1968823 RepID=UPI00261BFDFE|nr:helix-turn-helix domain-containing protein [Henriciella sp.]
MQQKLLSKAAVAEFLDLHPGSVMRLVRQGRFPQPLRTGDIGSAVRWREQDINDWIEERAAHAGGAS